jgi:predicted transcriptional regulator
MESWLEAIALNKELKWTDLRVLLFLLANVKGSSVEISQLFIAQKLDLKASNVSRSIRKLEEQEIIKKRLVAGKLVGYVFSIEE